MKLDWVKFERVCRDMIGCPYKYGAKWHLGDPDPVGPVDCSGFTRWAFSRIGVYIPHGSHAQYLSSSQWGEPGLGYLGFWKNGAAVHHVGILLGDQVIEARGCDKHMGHSAQTCPYNQIVLRPRAKWEAWREFTGWLLPDDAIKHMENR